jgi:hypothetical protein
MAEHWGWLCNEMEVWENTVRMQSLEIQKNLIQKRNCKVPDCWGLKDRDLLGIPWRVAFALQEDGWILRSKITWVKKNPMPESVKNRPTNATEEVFFYLQNQSNYFL